MGQQHYWARLNQPPCSYVMVQENHYPHTYDKAMEHFQEFELEELILCLVGVHVKYFQFDVELFLTKQDSLFVHLQPGVVILFVKL